MPRDQLIPVPQFCGCDRALAASDAKGGRGEGAGVFFRHSQRGRLLHSSGRAEIEHTILKGLVSIWVVLIRLCRVVVSRGRGRGREYFLPIFARAFSVLRASHPPWHGACNAGDVSGDRAPLPPRLTTPYLRGSANSRGAVFGSFQCAHAQNLTSHLLLRASGRAGPWRRAARW